MHQSRTFSTETKETVLSEGTQPTHTPHQRPLTLQSWLALVDRTEFSSDHGLKAFCAQQNKWKPISIAGVDDEAALYTYGYGYRSSTLFVRLLVNQTESESLHANRAPQWLLVSAGASAIGTVVSAVATFADDCGFAADCASFTCRVVSIQSVLRRHNPTVGEVHVRVRMIADLHLQIRSAARHVHCTQ